MNTSFHADGFGFFRRTKAYAEQRQAYKKKLISEYSATIGDNHDSRLFRIKRSIYIASRMFVYRMRLLF